MSPLSLLLASLWVSVARGQLSGLVEAGDVTPPLYQLVRISTTGHLTPELNLSWPSGMVSGVSAAGAGLWWASPPFAEQATQGLYLVNASSKTWSRVKVKSPPGFSGDFIIGELVASDVPGDAVGLLAPKNGRAWLAIAEISPQGGAPRVRMNLSTEGAGFEQIVPSFASFDKATRTLWFAATVDGADLVMAAPLDGPSNPTSLFNASLAIDPIALAWVSSIQTVVAVGLVAPPQTWGIQALDRHTQTWRNITVWPETFYLSGLGQVAVDDTGRNLTFVVADAEGHPTLPVVDCVAEKEVARIVIRAKDLLANIGFV